MHLEMLTQYSLLISFLLLDTMLGKGDSSVIGNWLKEHIHQYGQTYSTREMLKKATGEELNTGYYIEYLKEKYLH